MSGSVSHQDLSDLIGRIYDCTLDPTQWTATIDFARELAGARLTQFGILDRQRMRAITAVDIGVLMSWSKFSASTSRQL